jgi:hypothetical protein
VPNYWWRVPIVFSFEKKSSLSINSRLRIRSCWTVAWLAIYELPPPRPAVAAYGTALLMLRPRERLGHVTRCLLSAASGGASSSSGGGGIAAAADPTSAAEDKTSQRQRLWSGLSGTGDPRGRLTVPPQFRSVADGTPPPHLHDAGADPRSREELARRHDEMRGLYEGRGYVVCRGFLSSEQVQECRSATARIIDDWPHRTAPAIRDAPGPPFVDLDPRVVAGEVEPASPQLAVRRLFRIATHEEVFRRRIVEDEDLLGLTKALLGEDLKLVQSMALLKPPGTGEKRWHQDQGVRAP